MYKIIWNTSTNQSCEQDSRQIFIISMDFLMPKMWTPLSWQNFCDVEGQWKGPLPYIVILHIEDHTYMYIVKYKMVHKNQNFDIKKLAPKI